MKQQITKIRAKIDTNETRLHLIPGGRNPTIVTLACGHEFEAELGEAIGMSRIKAAVKDPDTGTILEPEVWVGSFRVCPECPS